MLSPVPDAMESRLPSARVSYLLGHSRRVLCLAWNTAGTILASGSEDGTIRLWSVDAMGQVSLA